MSSMRNFGLEAASEHVLLKFNHRANAAERDHALRQVDGTVVEEFGRDEQGDHVLRVHLGRGHSVGDAVQTLSADTAVSYAEPDYIVHATALSNDPGYTGGRLWGMEGDKTSPYNPYGSQAGEAWAAGYTGSSKVAVGVIDTGIDYRHPDLYLNIWLNNGEIPTAFRSSLIDTDKDGTITFRDLNASANASYVRDVNSNGRIDAGDLLNDSRWEDGIDTDANGYRDDLIGWDFANNDNDPFDDAGHGTHVAGTIAGMGGNGVGVAGVTWSTLLVPLKFLGADGSGYTSNATKGVDYFTAAAARSTSVDFVATSNSWGGGGYTQTMMDAIVRGARQDILFVAAAGNGGSDGYGDNNDSLGNWPSNYNTSSVLGWDAVIGVSAITSTGGLASYSNYGAKTVEIGAPGSSVYSTLPNNGYGYYSGTSMATPHVTGAIALVAAATGLHAADLRAHLLASAIATSSLTGKTMTGGRLDVMGFLDHARGTGTAPAPTPTPSPSGTIYGTDGSETVKGTLGNDTISGVPASSTTLGRGTIDTLKGNGGNDTFILGDARGRFYDDGRSLSAGNGDYARITDFNTGDHLQLRGTASDYWLRSGMSLNGTTGTGVYYDTNHNHLWDSNDELIALVAGSRVMTSGDFLFV